MVGIFKIKFANSKNQNNLAFLKTEFGLFKLQVLGSVFCWCQARPVGRWSFYTLNIKILTVLKCPPPTKKLAEISIQKQI